MSSLVAAARCVKNPDTVEDLEFVSHKIQELVSTFNKLNQSKGTEILAIGFNSVVGEMSCSLMTAQTRH
jgi:hypothetical protein